MKKKEDRGKKSLSDVLSSWFPLQQKISIFFHEPGANLSKLWKWHSDISPWLQVWS